MIYCIGDSHAGLWSHLPGAQGIEKGPHTAWNLRDKIPAVIDVLAAKGVKPDSDLVFLCGAEIDIRAHFLKPPREYDAETFKMASECADRFVDALLKLRKTYRYSGIYGPVASTWLEPGDAPGAIPTYGTCEQRNLLTAVMTGRLRSLSVEHEFPLISIYWYLRDPKTFQTRREFYVDATHVDPSASIFLMYELAKYYGHLLHSL